MQGHVQAKLLLDDCYQDIDADGDPDLRPHSILGSAVETFDAQVLLDPLEEQFHLPSAPVQGANGQRRQRKLVGQEHQVLAGLGIAIADAAQVAGVVLVGIEAVKGDGLVADEPRIAIHRRRIQAPCIEVLLGARDEEASRLIERVEPLEVQVTPIHDVEGAGLDKKQVQYIDVVHLAVGDVDEGGDRSPPSSTSPTARCKTSMYWTCFLSRPAPSTSWIGVTWTSSGSTRSIRREASSSRAPSKTSMHGACIRRRWIAIRGSSATRPSPLTASMPPSTTPATCAASAIAIPRPARTWCS